VTGIIIALEPPSPRGIKLPSVFTRNICGAQDPNIPTFISFFQVGVENVPQLPPPFPLKLKEAFSDETSYLFTISIIAAGVRTVQKVEVNWPGAWDRVTAYSV
jgi:hypothetical protein